MPPQPAKRSIRRSFTAETVSGRPDRSACATARRCAVPAGRTRARGRGPSMANRAPRMRCQSPRRRPALRLASHDGTTLDRSTLQPSRDGDNEGESRPRHRPRGRPSVGASPRGSAISKGPSHVRRGPARATRRRFHPELSVAVFVDGCFWHGCPEHGETPVANREFWEAKIAGTRERDQRQTAALEDAGWTVFAFGSTSRWMTRSLESLPRCRRRRSSSRAARRRRRVRSLTGTARTGGQRSFRDASDATAARAGRVRPGAIIPRLDLDE